MRDAFQTSTQASWANAETQRLAVLNVMRTMGDRWVDAQQVEAVDLAIRAAARNYCIA